MKPADEHYILGAQAQIWTEYIPTTEQVEYMTYPRLCALAEVFWSPQNSRNWDDFTRRLGTHCLRLEQLGVTYRKGSFEK